MFDSDHTNISQSIPVENLNSKKKNNNIKITIIVYLLVIYFYDSIMYSVCKLLLDKNNISHIILNK